MMMETDLPEHPEGSWWRRGGGGLHDRRSERIATIFKEEHQGTDRLEKHRQKDDWSVTIL